MLAVTHASIANRPVVGVSQRGVMWSALVIAAGPARTLRFQPIVDRGRCNGSEEENRPPGLRVVAGKPQSKENMAMANMLYHAIEVEVPTQTAYDTWTQFASFPHFMEGVEEVIQRDDRHLRWRARVCGKSAEWEAEVTEQIPGKRIAWCSTRGASNAGVVTFHRLSANRARIMLQMAYDPESWIEKIGDALGLFTRKVESDLAAFKRFVEMQGESVHGRPDEVRVDGERLRGGRRSASERSPAG